MTSGDLLEGDVTIDIRYPDLNSKDDRVMEPGSTIPVRHPITPGIDLAGTVTESANPRFVPGDKVLVNGFGLGTDRDGGLAQRTRVPGAGGMVRSISTILPSVASFEVVASTGRADELAASLQRLGANEVGRGDQFSE